MKDCSKEITNFHDKYVRLSQEDKNKLAGYREANKKRVDNGLKKTGNPLPVGHMNQGSYAMHTINQHPDNDYDIDVGVIFNIDDLKGKQSADKSPLDARKMVCEAVQDDKFNKEPKAKKNCVRIFYNEGHHVDIPVYRKKEEDSEIIIELASSEWIESDPGAVTKWFNQAVIDKSPDENNGRQMRRIVRLLKFWGKSWASWNMPTGFIISKLVDECYVGVKNSDDESFYETMVKIRDRLAEYEDVYHPVLEGVLISSGKESSVKEMKDRLDTAIDELEKLFDDGCTKKAALKIWKKIFNHTYFDELITNLSSAAYITKQEPKKPVDKKGDLRFG